MYTLTIRREITRSRTRLVGSEPNEFLKFLYRIENGLLSGSSPCRMPGLAFSLVRICPARWHVPSVTACDFALVGSTYGIDLEC